MPAIGTEFCWKLLGVPASASQVTDALVWLGQFRPFVPFSPLWQRARLWFIDQLIAFIEVRTRVYKYGI